MLKHSHGHLNFITVKLSLFKMARNITMQVKGINRTKKLFAQLPERLKKEIFATGGRFNRFVQKSAKLRAPRFTGKLAQSIRVITKNKEIRIIVDSPYGRFQDQGYRPHWVQIWRSTRAGLTIADWVEAKGVKVPFWRNSIFVSSFKPFITPALESGLNNLPRMLNQASKKAIQTAGA